MAIDELLPTSRPRPDRRMRKRSWWRRPWVFPLAAVTIGFLIYALPPYLSLDPATSRLPVPASPVYYPVLVTHILFGSIMLCCATLQVWPWLRRKHLRIHRWSGRLYVLTAIPVGVGGIVVAQFPHGGPMQQVGNTMLGLLLLVCTVNGYRAVRQRRIGDHREWMIRSFALAYSIVANRIWLMICLAVFGFEGPGLIAAIGISTWMSWVVNLLIAEWWLHRRRSPRSPTRTADAAA
jgi:uncharacterized membrane protein YozB (DUF420 family)